MSTTNLLILLGLGVVFFLVLILVVGLFIWRRRRSRQGEETTTPEEATTERRLQRLTSTNGTEEAIEESEPEAVPEMELASAATSSPTPQPTLPTETPLPISELDHPEGEKINILVVDDNPGTRDNVSRLLYFENDMEVIGQATNGRHGIEMAEDLRPHIVLMDINMPDMDGITATGKMSVQTPYSQVIIMSVQAEQHYMKQAMAAGARDFQPKPFTAEELVGTIRRVYEIGKPIYRQIEAMENIDPQLAAQAQAAQAGQNDVGGAPVIAVYSAKGGIGTSTIAVNLAAALQQQQGEIALVDADYQFGDISVHLNTRPARTVHDAVHEGTIDVELLPEVMLPHNSGLKLLLAPASPEIADEITPDMGPKVLKELKKHFKAVIVDTSTHLGDRTLNVLDTADYILFVVTPELPSIKSTKLFLELTQQLEWDPERILVVMNRANLPGGIPPAKIEQALNLSESYPIPYDPRIHAAINKGVAVTLQDSSAPSAKALHHLASTIWEIVNTDESTPEMAAAM